jgi:hypothetical protein
VFSFVGRCQGECGSAKNTFVPVSIANWALAGQFLPAVPGEGPAQLLGPRVIDTVSAAFGA